MIDEKKILKELQELVNKAPEGTLENKLLNGFLEYINRQPLITSWVIRFEYRMLVVLRVMGGIKCQKC